MNRRILDYLIFPVATAAAALAILIEVINPHSFLLHTGAFVRSIMILCILPLWLWLYGNEKSKVKYPGCVILVLASSVYLIYAINSLRQDRLYRNMITPTGHYFPDPHRSICYVLNSNLTPNQRMRRSAHVVFPIYQSPTVAPVDAGC